ncbi:addiction module toxin, RelE/StbE family [Ferroglobus placidus DSM 10642]|uniref:Addiction module toxin, RelE/StbE family n=1 Tax=Ferroglobus placidus (strain DSM 10642 / AEDII12DO) TaxID=589924 RepID=D3RXD9_FERPA|nr:type II toxin-antitoxin system RelE/ParE family toxin [Ferroglobus placidus]ADC65152.1 addiction module toxin, RelE/StbE family [Ferroglobus placidus DSM 10642]
MSYENRILISKSALKELKSLPESVRRIIKDRISKLAYFPLARLDVKKLRGYQNVYRMRVGDYRVIFEYSKENRTIRILKIGKRESVYD